MKGRNRGDANLHTSGTKRSDQQISASKRQRVESDGYQNASSFSRQQFARPSARRSELSADIKPAAHQQGRSINARMTSSNLMTRSPSQGFVNAPTSLANLAQLSGITLVPVGDNRPQNSNLEQFGSMHRLQAAISSSSSSSSGNSNLQSRSQSNVQNINGKTTVAKVTSAEFNRQRSTYNIASIPSIQLLNQQVSETRNSGPIRNKVRSMKANPSKYSRNRDANPGTSSPESNSRRTKAASFNSSNQHINLPPSIDVFPELIARSVDHPRPIEDMRPDSDPTMSFQELCQDDNEQEPNNISLMRLMAIFNNPALSLTPVDSVPASVDAHRKSFASNSSRNDSKLVQVKIEPQFAKIGSSIITHGHSGTSSTNQIKSKNAVRVPKSAANLMEASLVIASSSVDQPDAPNAVAFNTSHVYNLSTDVDDSLTWPPSVATTQLGDTENSVTLSWLPNKALQDDGDASNERTRSGSDPVSAHNGATSQTISVQMLHQFANQASNMDCHDSNHSMEQPSFGPECSPSVSRVNLQQLDKGARCQEVLYTVYSAGEDVISKPKKEAIRGTRDRLFLPRQGQVPMKDVNNLLPIHIEASQQKEVLVSERHLMLEKMVEIAETVGQRKQAPVEPDDIFVNRSKRIMSRIDTILEKKKRKRFERICHRSSPKNTQGDDLSDESDTDSIYEENAGLMEAIVVPIQLPLEEPLTDEKRKYLSHVGLISRTDRNRLSLQQCENRLKSISSLAPLGAGVVPDDVTRFVDTIVKTGGTNIQLRTETNIKRNELPFIEGLNRNTSRVKMNYMSVLGLDKRSKRTTLYKVTKTQEKKGAKTLTQRQTTDLTSKQESIPDESLASISQSLAQHILQPNTQNGNNPIRIEADLIARVLKLSNSSCREEIHVPKDEYMRSLGLIAS